jgi:hypothetical protein
MSAEPQQLARLPKLAGVCSYEEAARLGYSVEEDVQMLVRYAWIAKCAMEMGLYWLNPTSEWEIKEALSLHLYLDSQHVAWIRERVSAMRNPPPRMDVSPSESLSAFLNELLWAEDSLEKVVGLYGVLKPTLLAAYRRHYEQANPLVDYPTRRLLRMMIADLEETMAWGEAAIAALTAEPETQARAAAWREHLLAYLRAAGGVMGIDTVTADDLANVPPSRAQGCTFQPDFFPRRDARFEKQWNFIFPPHEVARTDSVPDDEKTLALMCKRALEMDVPEVMARLMAEAEGQPWDYYTDMARQLWDEARHAMMGTVYFEKHGVDWKREIPLHPGFAIRLNQHLSAPEAHAVLYAIEQSLMPASTGKKYEWVTAHGAGDELAQLFQDYDWADEVLHVHIGRRWLISTLRMPREQVITLGQEKAAASEHALDTYANRAPQVNWWPDFVRQVLGKDTATSKSEYTTADPVYQKR